MEESKSRNTKVFGMKKWVDFEVCAEQDVLEMVRILPSVCILSPCIILLICKMVVAS